MVIDEIDQEVGYQLLRIRNLIAVHVLIAESARIETRQDESAVIRRDDIGQSIRGGIRSPSPGDPSGCGRGEEVSPVGVTVDRRRKRLWQAMEERKQIRRQRPRRDRIVSVENSRVLETEGGIRPLDLGAHEDSAVSLSDEVRQPLQVEAEPRRVDEEQRRRRRREAFFERIGGVRLLVFVAKVVEN